jgi:hypothetical protein
MELDTDGSVMKKRILIRILENRDAGDVTKWFSRRVEGKANTLGTEKLKEPFNWKMK